MRRILAMIRKEFLEEFASPVSLVFFLILPLVFTAATAAGIGGIEGDVEEQQRMPLIIINEDGGELAQVLVDALPEVGFDLRYDEPMTDATYALTIPAGLTKALMEGGQAELEMSVPSNDRSTMSVEQHVRMIMRRLDASLGMARSSLEEAKRMDQVSTPEEERRFLADTLQKLLDVAMDPPYMAKLSFDDGQEVAFSDMAAPTQQASAGQIVTWVHITLLGAAQVLVNERLQGTLKRMLIMPAGRGNIILGKLAARLGLGLVQMTLLFVGGALIFGVRWGDHPLAVIAVSLAFALATSSLGILLSTFVRTGSQASGIVIGSAMAMSALGGAWYPIELTPAAYRQIVQILPTTWAMRAYTDLLARGADLGGVLLEVLVLLGFAALFITLGSLRFARYRHS